ncbi:MAG: phage holin family protein [Candidatus Omnitrophota bacterium]
MVNFLFKWLINILSLIVVVALVPGISIARWEVAVISVLLLSFINSTLRPLLVIFTLPFNILSLGLLTLFINAGMFYLTSKFIEGFTVENFLSAFWGSLLYSVLSFSLGLFFLPRNVTGPRARSYHCKEENADVIDIEAKSIDE